MTSILDAILKDTHIVMKITMTFILKESDTLFSELFTDVAGDYRGDEQSHKMRKLSKKIILNSRTVVSKGLQRLK